MDTAPQFLSFEAKLLAHLPLDLVDTCHNRNSNRNRKEQFSNHFPSCNYAIAIATNGDWLQNIESVFQPTWMRSNTKTYANLYAWAVQAIADNSDSFVALFAPVMSGEVIILQLVCSLSSSRNGKIFKSCENISHAFIVSFVIANTIQKIHSHLDARTERSV